MIVQPRAEYRVSGKHRIIKSTEEVYDGDPRGIIWLYEPPSPRARYVMGVDASQGRTGWSRYNRTEDDSEIDNGAIEVIRLGTGEPGHPGFTPDVQVAEYAAPIDPYDLATVANTMGRLYGGRNEDGQALAIIEVYPGPGGPTQRAMMEKYGYTNMYQWQFLDTGAPSETKKFDFGWYSSKQSMQHLWTRGLRCIHRRQLLFKSPFLVEEFADCEMDLVRLRGAAASGGHDDRATACLLAVWAGHNWTFSIEPQATRVETGPTVEWQATDISANDMQSAWDQRWEELSAEAAQDFG
jgi:hypothetical protein